jgi:hypothetical protein
MSVSTMSQIDSSPTWLRRGNCISRAGEGGGVALFENMIQVMSVQYMLAWNKAFLAHIIALFLHWNKPTFEIVG